MECERVREEFTERLTGSLDAERAKVVDEHVAGCSACKAETDRLSELWKELGTLRAPAASGAAGRVERLIDARTHGASGVNAAAAPARGARARRLVVGTLAVAASLVLGLVLGRSSARTPGIASNDAATTTPGVTVPLTPVKPQYLLLLHGPAQRAGGMAQWSAADSAAEAAVVAEYRAWAGRLRDSGALVSAEKLASDPVTMLSATGDTELPRGTADEIGGFFLIQADSAEAFRIARECPHLKHGGTVQVRRIEPT
jgi:hypothetical protein